MYMCPDINAACEECDGCEFEHVTEGESPCKPGECVRDGACYQKKQ